MPWNPKGSTGQRFLQLSPEEIVLAQAKGLTFSPRRRGKLKCNQASRIGVISSKQANLLRSQVWPKRRKSIRAPSSKGKMLTVELRNAGGATCPYCRRLNHSAEVGNKRCDGCRRTFIVKPVSTSNDWRLSSNRSSYLY